jgi:hypothetical protein
MLASRPLLSAEILCKINAFYHTESLSEYDRLSYAIGFNPSARTNLTDPSSVIFTPYTIFILT